MYPVPTSVIDCANTFRYSGIYYCEDIGDSELTWLKSYMDSFKSDCNVLGICNFSVSELELATNYLSAMNSIYQQGFNVFLGDMDEFNELNSYFGFSSASTADYNTNRIFQCVNSNGSLVDCSD